MVSGPPLAYLVVFFAIPTLIMVLASFRTPGEFGGLAPLVDETGKLDLNVDSYTRFLTEPVYANLEKHDQALLDAAQDLGANAWQRFWRITFPLSLPGVYAGAALVFIPALGIFAIPDILGGPNDTLIGNLIKQQFLETRDWPFGSVLSIVLTVSALLLAGLARWVGRRNLGTPSSAGEARA